jgi:2-polyprenyl-3-methyl-5-hydroxy-6-metoxy-1,4-benzoquinol methylase
LGAPEAIQEQGYDFPYHYIPNWDGKRYSHHRSLAWGHEYLSYLGFLLDLAGRDPHGSLLDVGCGDGRFLGLLHARHPGARLTGIDFSPRAIAFARAFHPDLDWRCEDAGDDTLLPERHDLITLVEVLEHIPPAQVGAFLANLRARLADEGRLILSVPSTNIRVSRKHYQHFDEGSLRQTLAETFAIEELHHLNIRYAPSLQLMRLLLHNRLFILNNRTLLAWCYRFYTRRHLHVKESNCRRLIAVCRPLWSTVA